MSRKVRKTQKNFKVFCEGDTEYRYIDEMRQQRRLSIALKPVNMKGGGYRNFLEQLKTDGTTNCLAKFIIIDGDRAVTDVTEKETLQELIDYCTLQNKSQRIPHFLIIDYPDFEYIACLHSPNFKGQDAAQFITNELKYKSVSALKADQHIYTTLNTGSNSFMQMLSMLNPNSCFLLNKYTINKTEYDIKIRSTTYDWKKLGRKGSNIKELFEVINYFVK